MSSMYKFPSLSPRKQEIGWMNIIFTSHDQFCDCKDPELHLLVLINRDSPVRKPLTDIQNIKCLLTGITTGETTEPEPFGDGAGFLEGELEDLFKENEGVEPTVALTPSTR